MSAAFVIDSSSSLFRSLSLLVPPWKIAFVATNGDGDGEAPRPGSIRFELSAPACCSSSLLSSPSSPRIEEKESWLFSKLALLAPAPPFKRRNHWPPLLLLLLPLFLRPCRFVADERFGRVPERPSQLLLALALALARARASDALLVVACFA